MWYLIAISINCSILQFQKVKRDDNLWLTRKCPLVYFYQRYHLSKIPEFTSYD